MCTSVLVQQSKIIRDCEVNLWCVPVDPGGSPLFTILTVMIWYTARRSTRHQGLKSLKEVWVHEPLNQLVSRLPSTATPAGLPTTAVVDSFAGFPTATLVITARMKDTVTRSITNKHLNINGQLWIKMSCACGDWILIWIFSQHLRGTYHPKQLTFFTRSGYRHLISLSTICSYSPCKASISCIALSS